MIKAVFGRKGFPSSTWLIFYTEVVSRYERKMVLMSSRPIQLVAFEQEYLFSILGSSPLREYSLDGTSWEPGVLTDLKLYYLPHRAEESRIRVDPIL